MHQPSSSAAAADDGPKPPPPAMGYPYPAAPAPSAAPNGGTAAFGVAYPYPAPPHQPQPQPQPYYYQPRPQPYPPPPPAAGLRRLLALAIAGLLIIGAASFILWLVLRPRAPAFSLAALSVSGLNVSTAASTISASFSVSLTAANPNRKMSVSYFSTSAAVSLPSSDGSLVETSLAPFSQAPRNSTVLTFHLVASGDYVGPDAASELARRGSGAVGFQVRFVSLAVFAAGAWRTRRHVVRVLCDDVPVLFTGKLTEGRIADGPPRPCYVGL